MEAFDSLVPALAHLRSLGYVTDFNLMQNCLLCTEVEGELNPEDFIIEHTYRFEANTDPDEQAVVYGVSSPKHNLKGVIVNSYSIYADPLVNAILKRMQPHE